MMDLSVGSMKLASMTYRKALASARPGFWSVARRGLIRIWHDPACQMQVHGRQLYMPLSHALPQHLRLLPLYDSLLTRLGVFLREADGHVVAVDVGANIGDTIAAMFDDRCAADRFMGIEPDPHYRSYLTRNWGSDARVTILPYFCGAGGADGGRYAIVEYDGTAEIRSSESGEELETRTLTSILADHPEFTKCNLIKVDTDGHDFEVLQGAREFIARERPVVFFECAPIKGGNFIRDCFGCLEAFRAAKYQSVLAYDNFGHLIGRFALDDLDAFANILFFQVSSALFFLDLLVMPEEKADSFSKEEIAYQASVAANPDGRTALQWLLQERGF